MHAKLTTLPKSAVRIEAELPAPEFEKYRSEAVKRLAERLAIPGFRKGTAPEAVLVRHAGDMAVLEEMAELAVRETYPKLVLEHKLDAIGAPSVSITKIGNGSPLGFSIETAVVPEVKLPKWKKFAEDIPLEPVVPTTDEEVEGLMKELREHHEKSGATGTTDDDLAKKLGDFVDAAALRAKLKENLGLEKEYRAAEKRRIEALDALAAGTETDIPDVLVKSELDRMRARLEQDLGRHKLSYDEYLKRVGKTDETLRGEWRQAAEKNVKIELALGRIAEEEKLAPAEAAVAEETKHFLEHNPGVSPEQARGYISSLLLKDLVIARLTGGEK